MMRHRFALFFVIGLQLLSQPESRAERLPIKRYTSADGLGSSFVDYLMRDSRGFMWFCTRDGLSRFDGSRFITYTIGDRNAPPGIESITETRDGSYWIGTTGGLYRLKRDAVLLPTVKNAGRPALDAEFIKEYRGSLFEDSKGNLWFSNQALFRITIENGNVSFREVDLNLPAIPGQPRFISQVGESEDGSLWLNSLQGLARRLPDGRIILYRDELAATEFNRLLLSNAEGRVWYLLGRDLYVIKPEPMDQLKYFGKIDIRSLNPTDVQVAKSETVIRLPDKAGELLRLAGGDVLSGNIGQGLFASSDKHVWLATDQELIEFDGSAFHRLTVKQGLPQGMGPMAEDPAGNLWVGGTSVLIRLDRRGLTSFGEEEGLRSTSIHAINEAKDGTLYFADGNYRLNRFDGKHFTTERPNIAPNARFLWSSRFAFLDSRNEWWFLTHEKLYRFAATDFEKPLATYSKQDGLTSEIIFQIHEDRSGTIWVSMRGADPVNDGLARFDRRENRFRTFTATEGFPLRKSASSFAEDKHGNMWIGFYEGGLVRYFRGAFTLFDTANGIPPGVITDLLIDRRERLWISSSLSGVSRIDEPDAGKLRLVSLTTDEGLSSNNVRTIAEDHFGNIYFGTVRGIDRISPETDRIKHYSVSDGLAGDFVVDSHCDRNGVMWFATTRGFSRLTASTDENREPLQVWLGGLRVAGVPLPFPEMGVEEFGPIELPHTKNNLELSYFALEFHPGEALRYQYQLEGADTDWGPPTEQRTVTFANLQPGSYRFLVRAVNAQGVPSQKPAMLAFRILPPLWLRWWFLALSTTIAAAIVALVSRQRAAARRERERIREALRRAKEERLIELEQVRKRIAADLHDDIGSNLTRISLLSEVAQHKLGDSEYPVREPLASIAGLSRELIDSMSEIVWAINPNKDHLEDLTRKMRLFASDVLAARQIDFHFPEADIDQDIKVGANVRREFFLIFKEGVNNIARHSGCTRVEIGLRTDGAKLWLTLRDDGRGFDSKQAAEGHGLVSMRERSRSLGGSLDIRSAPGQGTTLSLEIPIHPGTSPASDITT